MKNSVAKVIIHLLIPVPFFVTILSSCTGTGSSKAKIIRPQEKTTQPAPHYIKPPASYNDTLAIDGASVVFYFPDSLQLNRIRAVSRKDIYDTQVHNCFYLMRNARTTLKKNWPKIHIIETRTSRYLLFVKTDKSTTLIDLNSNGDMCGIFLFDGIKEPELSDMMNIDTALGFYFTK